MSRRSSPAGGLSTVRLTGNEVRRRYPLTMTEDHDAELDEIVAILESAGLLRQAIDEGRPALQLTPKGAQVATQMAMWSEDDALRCSMRCWMVGESRIDSHGPTRMIAAMRVTGGRRASARRRTLVMVGPFQAAHRVVATLAAISVVLVAAPVLGAQPTACVVRDTATGTSYSSLQSAVDAAAPWGKLSVHGECHGGTLIDRPLVIEGEEVGQGGRPTLDGDDRRRVVAIKQGVVVTIRGLTIERGRAFRIGGGILNRGTLVLRDVVVRRSRADGGGGGIYNEGTLRLRGASRISTNRNGYGSAGLYNSGIASLNDASSISHNDVYGVLNVGRLTLNDRSSIDANVGYGVQNGEPDVCGRDACGEGTSGSLTLNATSSISANRSFLEAYGVRNFNGVVTLNDASSISGHRNGAWSFGVYLDSGTLTMTGSSVIRDNHRRQGSTGIGGGILAGPNVSLVGVICAPLENANVYGNTPTDCLLY